MFVGIRDDGYLDFQTALVTGHLKTGMVGVLIILLGVLQSGFLVLGRQLTRDKTIEIELGNGKRITLAGIGSMRATVESLTPLVQQVIASDAEVTNDAVVLAKEARPTKIQMS